jgi:hypothetical protein
MEAKELLSLSEAARRYDIPRQALANHVRAQGGCRPVANAPGRSYRPAQLYRAEDLEAAVQRIKAAWLLPNRIPHARPVELSRQRVKCPVCGRRDVGSNVRGGWCIDCWCRRYNQENPIIRIGTLIR